MKKVTITIEGTIQICEYASTYKEFYDTFYMTLGWHTVDALYVDGNEEENLIKKKGKYVKVDDYFHDLFSEEGDHPLPVEVHLRETHGGDRFSYTIELADDEAFDIKKVQLVKSDREIECCPYFILAQHILYDGKEIKVNEEDEYLSTGIDGRYCSEYIIDYFENDD